MGAPARQLLWKLSDRARQFGETRLLTPTAAIGKRGEDLAIDTSTMPALKWSPATTNRARIPKSTSWLVSANCLFSSK